MRHSATGISVLVGVLLLLVGCGTTIQPRVGRDTRGPFAGFPREEELGPRPSPASGSTPETQSLTRQICRAQSLPSGWIAIRYTEGGEKCAESAIPENPYTAAVIEQYSRKAVGASMVVCADQPIPRNWTREWNREAAVDCPGARVRADAPTAFVMRRVR